MKTAKKDDKQGRDETQAEKKPAKERKHTHIYQDKVTKRNDW